MFYALTVQKSGLLKFNITQFIKQSTTFAEIAVV